jgi:hypothetical protein
MGARQSGISGLFILVILVLVALGVLAITSFNRVNDWTTERQNTTASLVKAAAALDAFAAASSRLPCPADPTVDAGVEVTSGANNCQFTQGTLPWNTLGLRRDDAYDDWAHKISYRVYTGSGGFTQAGGMSMTSCDIAVGTNGPDANGLCHTPHTTVATTTIASDFISGKGLQVIDFGTTYSGASPTGGAAYVVISHGPTGLGSYTSSGVQLAIPKGDEKDNTNATGPFHLEAFSDSNTSATDPSHFDDLLVYRLVTSVVKNAGLGARPWLGFTSDVVLNKNTLTTALGSNPHSDTGAQSIVLPNATVSAFNSSGAQDVSYVHGGGANDGIGGVDGGGGLLTSATGAFLTIDLNLVSQQFAFTVDNFNTTGTSQEQVQVAFFQVAGGTATAVGSSVVKKSCNTDTQSESFSVDAGVSFNRVVLTPITATGGGASDLSLSEMASCLEGVSCVTSLASSGHSCP